MWSTTVDGGAFELVERNATVHAARGGHSDVRSSREGHDTDLLVGELGEIALSRWAYGSDGDKYYAQRCREMEANPGDGGHDIPGIDVKTRQMKFDGWAPWTYTLLVVPKDYHPELRYVLATAQLDPVVVVYLVGWADQGQFGHVEEFGNFAGMYAIPSEGVRSGALANGILQPMEGLKRYVLPLSKKNGGVFAGS